MVKMEMSYLCGLEEFLHVSNQLTSVKNNKHHQLTHMQIKHFWSHQKDHLSKYVVNSCGPKYRSGQEITVIDPFENTLQPNIEKKKKIEIMELVDSRSLLSNIGLSNLQFCTLIFIELNVLNVVTPSWTFVFQVMHIYTKAWFGWWDQIICE